MEETLLTESWVGNEKTSWPVEELTAIWFVVPVAMTLPERLLRVVTPPEVEVEYLLPWASKSVPIVPLGVRNSVVEARPRKFRALVPTWSFVELLIWKTRKSPLYEEVTFRPMNVPEALGRFCVLEPRAKRDVEVDCGGRPESESAVPERVDWM